MKWIPAPPALVARFESAVARFPKGEKKKMFGYPALFINGNLAAGLFQDRMMLRLSEQDRTEFLREKGHRLFEPMPGKPMKEYVEASGELLAEVGILSGWLERSVAYAQSLKPKAKKAKPGARRS